MTERSTEDAEAHDASELYRALITVAPDAVIAIDGESRLLLCNRAAEQMFGYSTSSLIGQPLTMLMPERLRPGHLRGLAHYLSTGVRRFNWKGFPATGLRENGQEFPMSIAFAETTYRGARAFLGFLRDLSAEESIANALRRTERLHESVLASIGEGIVGLSPSGAVQFANPKAAAILALSVSALIGQDFHALTRHTGGDGVAHAAADCPILHALAAGRSITLVDERISRGSGERINVDVIATPLVDGAVVTGAVIAFRDIGERLRLEAELRQAHKLEAVGQLAAGIAHDYNNTLSVISAYAEFLTTATDLTQVREDAAAIASAVDRAAALTRQLLAFSRKQLLVASRVSAYEVVTALDPMLRPLIGEAITFVTLARTTDDTVLVDRGQLEQVLTNLVLNARDAMPHGGTLSVEVGAVGRARIGQANEVRCPCVVIKVTDTGVGMAEATLARATEPFFTTKEVGMGTGLGLATVSGIVAQSGGTLEIESTVGAGTTVRVLLPRAGPEVGQRRTLTPTATLAVGHARNTGTVLVVEDEEGVRRACVRILATAGYTVLEARHGADALLVAARVENIDLLLTDVVMPEVSGAELAEWFRTVYPGRPIVFMSGYTDDALVRQGVSTEQVRLVSKPFTSQTILSAVRDGLLSP
ncbi:MAG: PAS domain S-box protein [bacterium]